MGEKDRKDRARLTFLRSQVFVDGLFQDMSAIVLFAPRGSGKSTFIKQWIARQRKPINKFLRDALGEAHSDRHEASKLVQAHLDGLLKSISEHTHKINVLDLGTLSLFRNDASICSLSAIIRKTKVLIVADEFDLIASEELCRIGFGFRNVNDLAFSENDIAQLLRQYLGISPPSRYHVCLYHYTKGWPLAVIQGIEKFLEQRPDSTEEGKQLCHQTTQNCLYTLDFLRSRPLLNCVSLVDKFDSVPKSIAYSQGPLEEFSELIKEALKRGLLIVTKSRSEEILIECSIVGKIYMEGMSSIEDDSLFLLLTDWLIKLGRFQSILAPLFEKRMLREFKLAFSEASADDVSPAVERSAGVVA